jgi:glycosyltransferase involved in cell wall biosynthesis
VPSNELIISTYNNPRALELCLLSVWLQARRPDGICIADDGSGPETAAVIEAFGALHPEVPLRHVWHPDNGFQKCAILNRAIASSGADFLLFIDGDVLIHPRFVLRHIEMARPDRFSSGSLIRLDAEATAAMTADDVQSGRVFTRRWLRAHRAIDRLGTWAKTMPLPHPLQAGLDVLSPVQRAWCGANASAFRAAILQVNGYDETLKWGGEDKELGVRLANSGVKGQHLRFTAPLIHLDHPRPYADPEIARANKQRIREVRRSGAAATPHGIIRSEVQA